MRTAAQSWRDNWFAIHWLGALPLIRCVREPAASAACASLIGDVTMLAGGAIAMWWKMNGSMGKDALQETGEMVPVMWAGMAAGNLFYNTVKGTLCSTKPCEEHTPLIHTV